MFDAIETEELTKWYGANLGIDQLTMTVRRGEVFGFLGPNGAGKSTTIRTLLDFQRPTSGRARILGLDCARRQCGRPAEGRVPPGELTLFERMTGSSARVVVLAGSRRPRRAADRRDGGAVRDHLGSAGARIVQGQQAEGRACCSPSCTGPRW